MAAAVPQRNTSRPRTTSTQTPRRQLRVVSGGRRAVRFGVVVGIALFGLMFAVTAFQTQLAEKQLEVDRTEQEIAAQREIYDHLRMESATLRSPQRLIDQAAELGMVPARDVKFVEIDPAVVAAVLTATGDLDDAQALPAPDPFDDYSTVKAGVDGAS